MPFFATGVLLGVLRRLSYLGLIALALRAAAAPAAPIEVRVVVVTAFEVGEDIGDRPGEFAAWAAVAPEVMPFDAGYRHLRYDPKRGMLVVNTGMGTSRAAISTMALGLDPRFDLTHAYWMVAAIAGVDPKVGSAGSVAWIGDLIDTDYSYAIDPREVPKGWAHGIFPRDRSTPYEAPRGDTQYNLFALDKPLRDWAYALTRDVKLPDNAELQKFRAAYAGFPAGQTPPTILKGAEATGQAFWHGALLTDHVEKWVDYWTEGTEPFVMTGMEDTGVAAALASLGRLGKVDPARLLVLRTASNYTMPPRGVGAVENLTAEKAGYTAFKASLDAAFLVGTRVVDTISADWPRYRDTIPGHAAGKP
jgi:purine nucleoside permease